MTYKVPGTALAAREGAVQHSLLPSPGNWNRQRSRRSGPERFQALWRDLCQLKSAELTGRDLGRIPENVVQVSRL